MKQVRNAAQRRHYEKPRLREYGDLRRLTETDVAGGGMGDGSMYGTVNLKTSG